MRWSTENLPPTQHFEQWREACRRHVYALSPERRGRGHFQGSISRHEQDELDVTDIRCDGHLVRRSQRDIDEQPGDTYYIYLQGRGRVWFEQQGLRCVLESGDMVIADPNIPFSTGTDQLFDFRLWRVQRRRLQARLRLGSTGLAMHRIEKTQAERELIANWLDVLLHQHEGLAPPNAEIALDTLHRLVASVIDQAAPPQEPVRRARRRALLARVQREVTRRAAEMDLTPERMASAFGMSLRALHQLFALSGLSFQEFLTKARLERAQALLRAPECGHLSTAEIGFEAGFAEVSTFYRRFRQRHGMTPGEWRVGTASEADMPTR
ncbi:helix-turn-helix domain-containing protein [Hylemonella sp. W303a]|uniref:helix-turn-helix domain-containing protein n=1 Tax=Hylemonella sp. W303a TaxID=3389873 RepID=UPI00396B3A55